MNLRNDLIRDDHHGLERLVFFSDAVFAIAVTLLALEIRLPDLSGSLTERALFQALLSLWPKYLGYAISFLVIGGFWTSHHRKFRYICRYDGRLLTINLLLLMVIAFIPFPTSVVSAYGNQVGTIFYAGVMAVAGLLSGAIWWYAAANGRLTLPRLERRVRLREGLRPLFVPLVFAGSIGLSFLDSDIAKASWALIALVSLLGR